MPAKSRKNRRNIPQNRNFAAQQAKPAAPSSAAPTAASVRSVSATPNPAKAPTATLSYPHISGELKWIGLVTVFIVAVLVLTYVFLPK